MIEVIYKEEKQEAKNGENLFNLAVKNRNFSAHEISCHFLLESAFRLILFADD